MIINEEIMKNRMTERQNKHKLFVLLVSLYILILGSNGFAQEQEIDVKPEDLKIKKDYFLYVFVTTR